MGGKGSRLFPNLVSLLVLVLAAYRFWAFLTISSQPAELAEKTANYMNQTEGNFYLGVAVYALLVILHINFWSRPPKPPKE